MGCDIPPFHPNLVAISLSFDRSGGIPRYLAASPQNRPGGESAHIQYFQDFAKILLRSRPRNQEVRNSDLSAKVSGDFAKFRPIGRNVAESHPFSAEPASGGPSNSRDFSSLHGDISTQSTAESIGAQFRSFDSSMWRLRWISEGRAEYSRSSPLRRRTCRMADPRTSGFFRTPWGYYYAIALRIMRRAPLPCSPSNRIFRLISEGRAEFA